MPYIKPDDRVKIILDDENISTPGELNYFISTLINWYIHQKGKSYSTLNEVVGVFKNKPLKVLFILK